MKQIKALAYARVSTAEQAEADLSIPAQLKEIKKYALANSIEIIEEFIDEGLSAYNDETKRIAFNQMVEYAKSSTDISLILVHEYSRFSRNKYHSAVVKNILRKHGVTVLTTKSPYDANTIAGLWLESIDETSAQVTSMIISEHTIKGMKENAEKRDPETGYCYKNGGRAPYGYSLKRIPWGKDKKGQIKHKLLWEKNPETSKVLRMIVVDWRINEGLSYKNIRDRLNSLNIPGPEGKPWGDSTIREMLVENRLEQYTGIYYWNKEDHNTSGKRYKDKSEWIKVENAHPAILTMDEVKSALAVTKNRQPRTPAGRSYNSPWLLTGINLEGNSFFTCKECGKNIIGIQGRNNSYGYYSCGTYNYKGTAGCTNKNRINRHVIENELLKIIEEKFGTPGSIETIVNKINSRLNENLKAHNASLENLNKEIETVEKNIELTFFALSEGLDAEICKERLEKYKKNKLELQSKKKDHENNRPQPINIDVQKAKELFSDYKRIYQSGTNEQKRLLFRTYINSMEFDPSLNLVNIAFNPEYLFAKINRGDCSPRSILTGVGRGT